ncbi:hypothetical protein CsSME_00045999 [Camellia sinensis var. sinensis]
MQDGEGGYKEGKMPSKGGGNNSDSGRGNVDDIIQRSCH